MSIAFRRAGREVRMAEWQAELETLLSHLHVSLEHEPVTSRNDTSAIRRLTEDGAVSDVSVVAQR